MLELIEMFGWAEYLVATVGLEPPRSNKPQAAEDARLARDPPPLLKWTTRNLISNGDSNAG